MQKQIATKCGVFQLLHSQLFLEHRFVLTDRMTGILVCSVWLLSQIDVDLIKLFILYSFLEFLRLELAEIPQKLLNVLIIVMILLY